jgi:choice-of-anchor A domain-containing protein
MLVFLQKLQSLAIVGLLLATVSNASADLVIVLPAMGDLQNSAVFSLGGGVRGDQLSHANIEGDVRVAGNGDITLSGNTVIDGDLYHRSNGTVTMSRNAKVTGAVYNNADSELDNGVTEAISASNDAFALAPNRPYSNINLLNGRHNITVTGAPGETVVLTLRNFRLANNAVFTLQATATTTFIINVSGQFSLSGHARIVLSGGVQWNNVLFNVRGTSGAVSISGHASLQGILMANQRAVTLGGHAEVIGEIIAKRVDLSGASRVTHPPITSP